MGPLINLESKTPKEVALVLPNTSKDHAQELGMPMALRGKGSWASTRMPHLE